MSVGTRLYPAIMPSSMPSFDIERGCTIFFSISSYNSIEDISSMQISVKHQKSNLSALKDCPTGILPMGQPNSGNEILLSDVSLGKYFNQYENISNKYYFNLSTKDVDFVAGEIYKVQVRLVGRGATPQIEKYRNDMSEVYNDAQYYSEWSTICLIKPISQPSLYLNDFNEGEMHKLSGFTSFFGGVDIDPNNKEMLSSYRLQVTDVSTDKIVMDSGVLHPETENSFQYNSEFNFLEGENYSITYSIETTNGYRKTVNYDFMIVSGFSSILDGFEISANLDNDNGRIRVHMYHKENSTSEEEKGIYELREPVRKNNIDYFYRNSVMSTLYTHEEEKKEEEKPDNNNNNNNNNTGGNGGANPTPEDGGGNPDPDKGENQNPEGGNPDSNEGENQNPEGNDDTETQGGVAAARSARSVGEVEDDFVLYGTVVLRRTDNRSNFCYWEDLIFCDIKKKGNVDIEFFDITVEDGIWYKYGMARVSSKGEYGVLKEIPDPLMPIFDSPFLVARDKILKIPYNTTVSSFKRNGLESKTETLGSKYPYVRKNGYVDYKSFSLSTLVTAMADNNDIFSTKILEDGTQKTELDVYKSIAESDKYKNLYHVYNEKNLKEIKTDKGYVFTDRQYDFIYEKAFRDMVMDFLYKHDVKLFKSPTEGNIMIKLMSINFAPQEQLGRLIYTMNCEAVEIAKSSVYNYHKYNIIPINKSYVDSFNKEAVVGRVVVTKNLYSGNSTTALMARTFSSDQQGLSIQKFLQDKHSVSPLVSNNNTRLLNIKDVRLSFENPPSLISLDNDRFTVISGVDQATKWTRGHLIEIDGRQIIVSPILNYYEVPSDTTVNDIVFYDNDVNVTMDYVANVEEVFDFSKHIYDSTYSEVIGQIYDSFEPNDSIVMRIASRYGQEYGKYNYRLSSISGVAIEAEPGTYVSIKDSYDNEAEVHKINQSGYLRIWDDEVSIKEMKIYKLDSENNKIKATALVDYHCTIERRETTS